jgi:hypothetical protein
LRWLPIPGDDREVAAMNASLRSLARIISP